MIFHPFCYFPRSILSARIYNSNQKFCSSIASFFSAPPPAGEPLAVAGEDKCWLPLRGYFVSQQMTRSQRASRALIDL